MAGGGQEQVSHYLVVIFSGRQEDYATLESSWGRRIL